jgi:muramoyltetrapeptide carboxypeptidase
MRPRFPFHPVPDRGTVALISPSSATKAEEVTNAIKWLEGEGLKGRPMPHAFDNFRFFAGTDEDRAKDLMDAAKDPEVHAIWCCRGGYGAHRLFPFLDFKVLATCGKPLIGFSDITALHLAIVRRGGVGLHGPVATQLNREREPWVWESLHNCLRGGDPIPAAAPKGKMLAPGKAEGLLDGGCLTLLADSIGMPLGLDPKGKIVLIEDTGERPHRVDAMLTHLIQGGRLKEARGIVVGQMVDTDGTADPSIGGAPWREIVEERLKPLGLPVITDYPFGHIRHLVTLPVGAAVEMDAEAGILRFKGPYTRSRD